MSAVNIPSFAYKGPTLDIGSAAKRSKSSPPKSSASKPRDFLTTADLVWQAFQFLDARDTSSACEVNKLWSKMRYCLSSTAVFRNLGDGADATTIAGHLRECEIRNPRLRSFHFAFSSFAPSPQFTLAVMQALPNLRLETLSLTGSVTHRQSINILENLSAALLTGTHLKVKNLTLTLPPFRDFPVCNTPGMLSGRAPAIIAPTVTTLTFPLNGPLKAEQVKELSVNFPNLTSLTLEKTRYVAYQPEMAHPCVDIKALLELPKLKLRQLSFLTRDGTLLGFKFGAPDSCHLFQPWTAETLTPEEIVTRKASYLNSIVPQRHLTKLSFENCAIDLAIVHLLKSNCLRLEVRGYNCKYDGDLRI